MHRHKRNKRREIFKFFVERHETVNRINSFFIPMQNKIYIRRKKNAFHKWQHFYQSCADKEDTLSLIVVHKHFNFVIKFFKQYLIAKNHFELRIKRRIFNEIS